MTQPQAQAWFSMSLFFAFESELFSCDITIIPFSGLESPKEDQRLSQNLCGDLQTGELPLNPIRPAGVQGHAYPL